MNFRKFIISVIFPLSAQHTRGEDIKIPVDDGEVKLVPQCIAWETLLLIDLLIWTYIYCAIFTWFGMYFVMHYFGSIAVLLSSIYIGAVIGNIYFDMRNKKTFISFFHKR